MSTNFLCSAADDKRRQCFHLALLLPTIVIDDQIHEDYLALRITGTLYHTIRSSNKSLHIILLLDRDRSRCHQGQWISVDILMRNCY